MFKRVLLLAVLAAVLVGPVAASDLNEYTFIESCDSLDAWTVSGLGTASVAGGVLTGSIPETSGWGHLTARLPVPYGGMYDFAFTCDLGYLARDSQVISSIEVGLVDNNSHRVASYVFSDPSINDYYSSRSAYVGSERVYYLEDRLAYSACEISGVLSVSRSGANVTVSFNDAVLGTGVVDTDPLTYVDVKFGRYRHYPYCSGEIDNILLVGDVYGYVPPPAGAVPCLLSIYDADTRLPLLGSWDYYFAVSGSDPVSGSAAGTTKVVYLPKTSILQPHLLRVTKEGYEHVGSPQMVAVPAGGCEVKVYLRDMQKPAAAGNVMVTFACTDADSGAPVHSALVNLNGTTAQYTGSSGLARFEIPANSTVQWVASSGNHWPMGGDLVVGTEDVTVPVALVRKTSELPRPPLPELPNFPVIHPSLDPAGFRMQILSVPLLGSLASPLLDTVDSLGVGLNNMATAVLDVLTAPADYITGAVSSVGQNLIDTATPYLVTSSLLLQVIGAVISCIPEQVCGLVTFGLLLDIARILLWGPA